MIYGIGTDIVHIPRIEKLTMKKRFLERFFSEKEIELFKKRNFDPNVIAGNFAVKEAFSKAIKTGISFEMRKFSVERKDSGEPFVRLIDLDMYKKYNGKIKCSISHDGEYAVAFVIVEE